MVGKKPRIWESNSVDLNVVQSTPTQIRSSLRFPGFLNQPIPVLVPAETIEGFRVDQTPQEMGRNREGIAGRGERIRTSDSCVPNAVLYQAELHPVTADKSISTAAFQCRRTTTKSNSCSRACLNSESDSGASACRARSHSWLAAFKVYCMAPVLPMAATTASKLASSG
jgi:hypothetical protein